MASSPLCRIIIDKDIYWLRLAFKSCRMMYRTARASSLVGFMIRTLFFNLMNFVVNTVCFDVDALSDRLSIKAVEPPSEQPNIINSEDMVNLELSTAPIASLTGKLAEVEFELSNHILVLDRAFKVSPTQEY